MEFFVPTVVMIFANNRIGGAFFLQIFELPLYFQSIHGATPSNSGLRLIPLILAMTIFTVGAAILITTMGIPMYIMIMGAALTCIASGLVYTFSIDTPSGRSIAYLVILGCGYGFTLQTGMIVGQVACSTEDTAATVALLNCTIPKSVNSPVVALLYGGAIFIAIAQNIFSNTLIQGIKENVPGVDPRMVINSGATGLQTEIIQVFMASLKYAFIPPIALNGLALFVALLLFNRNEQQK